MRREAPVRIHRAGRAGQKVPRAWREDIERVLITRQQLARRVRALARQIEHDFGNHDLVVVALLNGTIPFLADLMRHLAIPLRLDCIGVSSYRLGTESGELVFTKELRLEVGGRDVLIVDDIMDTGHTLVQVIEKLKRSHPRSIHTCVLLEKKVRRDVSLRPDYVGFRIPNLFVVGYGLDFAECHRHLPFIGVLHRHRYHPS